MAKLEDFITSGLFLMVIIVGLSIFVGGVYSKYPDASVNDSFRNTYDYSESIYEKTRIIERSIINNDSEEGEFEKNFNVFDAFGVLKSAFLNIPAILLDTISLLIGKGGILYIFALSVGIPLSLLNLLLAIVSMTLVFLVLRAVIWGRGS